MPSINFNVGWAFTIVFLAFGAILIVIGMNMDPSNDAVLYKKLFSAVWTEDQFSEFRQIYFRELPRILTRRVHFLSIGWAAIACSFVLAVLAWNWSKILEIPEILVGLICFSGAFTPLVAIFINNQIHNAYLNPCVTSECEYYLYSSNAIVPAEVVYWLIFLVCLLVALVASLFSLGRENRQPAAIGMSTLSTLLIISFAVSSAITIGQTGLNSAMGLTPMFFSWAVFWWVRPRTAFRKALHLCDKSTGVE